MRTTQKQNILRYLLHGPLCGVHDDWELGRRIAARIHELRGAGFLIGTTRCTIHEHNHRTNQIMYSFPVTQGWPGLIRDWCAYCGMAGVLRYVRERYGEGDDSVAWLLVQCDRCGKKDYR